MKSSSRFLIAPIVLSLFAAGCAMQAKQSTRLDNVLTPEMKREAALTSALQGDGGNATGGIKKGKVANELDNAVTAKVTAQIFSQSHYLQQPLNEKLAARLLDRFFDSLDPLHLYFLQSDVEEFEKLRANLADRVMERGDTAPAAKIFKRFLERFDAQVTYVNELLKNETFTFEGNETFSLDRKNAPRPKDIDEAKRLWHDRLRYEYLQEKLNKQKPEEIVNTLTRRYSRISRALHEYDNDDMFELYLNALAQVYDPHSNYMGRAANDNFDIQMKLSLVGIGALLQSEDGYCKVAELIPGGPAERSKQVKVGDKIIKVAQGDAEPVDVVDMKIDNVVSMIRGKKDTTVRLTIIPVDAPDPSTRKIVSLVREEIKLEDQAAKAKLIETPAEGGKTLRLGVIDLPSFYEDMGARSKGEHTSTTSDVAKLLTKLKAEKVDGVVLDLRRNGGGSLEEAIRLTGLFIKQGPVVQVRDSDGTIRVDKDPDAAVLYDGPLVVLTSKGSASASEILAGALQDYDRALIVGDKTTFGKGTVQAMVQLAPIMKRYGLKMETDPGALKLTIQKFYLPGGSSTQLKGVVADINIPSVNDYTDIGEKSLDNPLPWDTVPPAKFDKLNRTQSYLSELKKRSQARIATDKDLLYRRDVIERFKKAQAQKSVSLNEKQRLQEKTELEARIKARKQDLASRPPAKEKVYELTLKQAAMPGLPAPLDPKGKTAQNAKPKPVEGGDTDTDSLEADTPEVDITLEETKRVLTDLIALSEKAKPVAKK